MVHYYGVDALIRTALDQSFLQAIRSAPGEPVEVYSEALESYRFTQPDHEVIFRDYLKSKYGAMKIDVVVAVFDPAINFVLRYRAELFPNVPIVFYSNNQPSSPLGPGMTGLWHQPQIEKTIELAKRLHPDTRQLVVIDSIHNNSGSLEKQVRAYFESQPRDITLTYLKDLSLNQVLANVEALPPHTVILYIRQAQEGMTYQIQALETIAKKATAPVYIVVDTQLGAGAVGGELLNTEWSGGALAGMALRVANGERPEDIKLEEAVGAPMFDWRQLQRWSISERSLPAGSIIRFKQATFWEQYKWRVIGAAAIVALQSLLIVLLLIERARRQRAMQGLQASEERLAKSFRANPQPISLTSLAEGRFLEVNDSFVNMSGYGRHDILQQTSIDLGFWSSVTDHQSFVSALREQGSVKNFETRFRTKDGSLRTLLSSAELFDIAGESCVLMASSDITERKAAEQQLAELTDRLLRTQEEERRHIARELHDVTAQSVGVILLNLAQMQKTIPALDSRNNERLSESLGLGDEVLKEIRTLSYVLHPPLLDQAGLVTALRWYLKGFSERTGLKVGFTERGNNGDRMAPDIEYAFFRVVQECLTNIRRHTDSETADINLTHNANAVILRVEDRGTRDEFQLPANGDGIEKVGVGIQGMQHRLRQLGGTLVFESTARGTTVRATVPLNGRNHDTNSTS